MGKKNDMMEMPEQTVTLQDYCSGEKIDAFCEYYVPAETEGEGTEVFNDARLREFFKAVPCALGDPLSVYLAELRQRGFRMKVSLTGEPAIFCNVAP